MAPWKVPPIAQNGSFFGRSAPNADKRGETDSVPQFDPYGRAGYDARLGFSMSHNTFGHLFRVTTFGESHGVALGCVVDGCPPGIALGVTDIQPYLDQRRPGQ